MPEIHVELADGTGNPITPPNTLLLQAFEWNVPADKKHYKRLLAQAEQLKEFGVDVIWLPPGCKAAGGTEANGYDIYDLYDLGEFDQKGGVSTKFGTKEELIALGKKCEDLKMLMYWDAVLNHRTGADNKEKVTVREVSKTDHNKAISDDHEIEAWLGFDYPGRNGKYSEQKYHWYHFGGTDYDASNDKTGIFQIVGENKKWSDSVGGANGNADFLMFADLDYSHPEVEADVKKWGKWILQEIPALKGFRLDACQHFSARFTNEWIGELRQDYGEDVFFVGEYLSPDVGKLTEWLGALGRPCSLFDSPLIYNFSRISQEEGADLRKVFDKTLVSVDPIRAVTSVMSHDTQPGQTVETPVEGFFKPLAYSLILLRVDGYPCVFYGDLYGMKGEKPEPPACGGQLSSIMLARKLYAYGSQDDYWDDKNCLGFVRRGTRDKPDGLACIMSNTGPAEKQMHVGKEHKGEVWTDVLGWAQGEVTIDNEGNGKFQCPGTSVGIWVNKAAAGREKFENKFDDDIYKE